MLSKRQWTEIEKRTDIIMYELNTGVGVNVTLGKFYLIDGCKETLIGRFTTYKELKSLQDQIIKTIKSTNDILENLEVTTILKGGLK